MNLKRAHHAGSIMTAFTLVVCSGVVAITALWAFAPSEPPPSQDLTTVQPFIAAAAADQPAPGDEAFPSRVLSVSLNDELFPESSPVESAAPPPPPKLEVDLIAITMSGGMRSVFGYDRAAGEYFSAAAGEAVPSGPIVSAIEERAAVFDVAGRQARLELTP
ncbi:MAG: hypothetical protein H6814_09115 [Phycisphaeraceae bacterium]|nr:hypothetical protein [Phycisphaeraceae bacterium]